LGGTTSTRAKSIPSKVETFFTRVEGVVYYHVLGNAWISGSGERTCDGDGVELTVGADPGVGIGDDLGAGGALEDERIRCVCGKNVLGVCGLSRHGHDVQTSRRTTTIGEKFPRA
jgi:hypothetical protein